MKKFLAIFLFCGASLFGMTPANNPATTQGATPLGLLVLKNGDQTISAVPLSAQIQAIIFSSPVLRAQIAPTSSFQPDSSIDLQEFYEYAIPLAQLFEAVLTAMAAGAPQEDVVSLVAASDVGLLLLRLVKKYDIVALVPVASLALPRLIAQSADLIDAGSIQELTTLIPDVFAAADYWYPALTRASYYDRKLLLPRTIVEHNLPANIPPDTMFKYTVLEKAIIYGVLLTNKIFSHNVATNERKTLDLPEIIQRISFSPDNAKCYALSLHNAYCIDSATMKIVATIPTISEPEVKGVKSLDLFGDVAVVGFTSGVLRIVPIAEGKKPYYLPLGSNEPLKTFYLSEHGKFIACIYTDGTFYVYDLAKQQKIVKWPAQQYANIGTLQNVILHESGNYLVLEGSSGAILADLNQGNIVRKLPLGHYAFSDSGAYIIRSFFKPVPDNEFQSKSYFSICKTTDNSLIAEVSLDTAPYFIDAMAKPAPIKALFNPDEKTVFLAQHGRFGQLFTKLVRLSDGTILKSSATVSGPASDAAYMSAHQIFANRQMAAPQTTITITDLAHDNEHVFKGAYPFVSNIKTGERFAVGISVGWGAPGLIAYGMGLCGFDPQATLALACALELVEHDALADLDKNSWVTKTLLTLPERVQILLPHALRSRLFALKR